ncbi:MAG: ACT domain-containing protein [Anaerolineae bacterium]|nr:ACT domain-containing protein [Anaerolineae bacterium]
MSNDSSPQKQFVITILSRDRVGIIADVSDAISTLEGDIADLRESVLRGYLTMIFLVTFPASQTADTIRQSLQAINTRRVDKPPLEVIVRPADDSTPAGQSSIPPDAYVLTATGSDKIGFVASVSGFCARHDINILDLSTAVSDGDYTMILLVDLSERGDVADIRRRLQDFGQETGLRIVLQHYDIFKATNEVSLL